MRFLDNTATAGGFGKAGDSDEDTTPLIPDLDDVHDEDMQLQVSNMNTFTLCNNRRLQYLIISNHIYFLGFM